MAFQSHLLTRLILQLCWNVRIIAKLGRNFCTKSYSYCWKYLTVTYDSFHFRIIFGTIISLFFIIIAIMVIIIYYYHYNHYYGITVMCLIIMVIQCVKSVQIYSVNLRKVRIQENTDQKNSVIGHISCSDSCFYQYFYQYVICG